jgi:hypothetical protein
MVTSGYISSQRLFRSNHDKMQSATSRRIAVVAIAVENGGSKTAVASGVESKRCRKQAVSIATAAVENERCR